MINCMNKEKRVDIFKDFLSKTRSTWPLVLASFSTLFEYHRKHIPTFSNFVKGKVSIVLNEKRASKEIKKSVFRPGVKRMKKGLFLSRRHYSWPLACRSSAKPPAACMLGVIPKGTVGMRISHTFL